MTGAYRTDIPEIQWPGIPSGSLSLMLKTYFHHENLQWLDSRKLETLQLVQLRHLVQYARVNCPYYRRKLSADLLDNETLTRTIWEQVPLLHREDLQKQGNDLLSTIKLPRHGKKTKNVTSGSTGAPVTTYGSDLTNMFWQINALRDHMWHNRCFYNHMAVIRYNNELKRRYPRGHNHTSWGGFANLLQQTGPSSLLDIRAPIDIQAEFLLRENPHYLVTYPTNLRALLNEFRKIGQKPERLQQVSTISESLDETIRGECTDVLGVDIKDVYSCREVGYVALQCPENNHYHTMSESVFVEVIDDNGKSCGPGETGRIVVTSLNNFIMPIIRYCIGDYAVVGAPCSCGRGLPVLTQILGRVRNMITLPNGEKKWPSYAVRNWSESLPISQFQFIQKKTDEIDALLVTERQLTDEEVADFTATLHERFFYPFRINIIYTDTIPRSKGGKYEEFKSEITD